MANQEKHFAKNKRKLFSKLINSCSVLAVCSATSLYYSGSSKAQQVLSDGILVPGSPNVVATVVLTDNGTLTVGAGASIQVPLLDAVTGALLGVTPSLLDNLGTITGINYGVRAGNFGTINNAGNLTGNLGAIWTNDITLINNSGLLSSNNTAVLTGALGTLINSGTINAGGSGVSAAASTIGSFQNTGIITANLAALSAVGLNLFDNSGTITSTANAGVSLTNLGVFQNSGSITGATYGLLTSVANTITNTGTITGNTAGLHVSNTTGTLFNNHGTVVGTGGEAVQFVGNGADTLNFYSGSNITGNISLGAGSDILNIFDGSTIAGNMDLGAGDDTMNLYDVVGVVGDVLFGDGTNTMVLHQGAGLAGNVVFGNGTDVMTIGQGAGVVGNLTFGEGSNTLNLGSAATVAGNILFGDGADTVSVGDGAGITGNLTFGEGVGNLSLGSAARLAGDIVFGDDADTVSLGNGAGVTGDLTFGEGANSLNLGDEATLAGDILFGDGDDILNLGNAAGIVGDVTLGNGANTLDLGNGATLTGDIIAGTGVDTMTFGEAARMVGNVTLGDGSDVMNLLGGAVVTGNVLLGNGADVLTLAEGAGVLGDIVFGEGDDVMNINPNVSLPEPVNFGDGYDVLNIFGGGNNEVEFTDPNGRPEEINSNPRSVAVSNDQSVAFVERAGFVGTGVEVPTLYNAILGTLFDNGFEDFAETRTFGADIQNLSFSTNYSTGNNDYQNRFWMRGFGARFQQGGTNTLGAIDGSVVGLATGFERGFVDEGIFGVFTGLSNSNSVTDGSFSGTKSENYFGGLYHKRNFGDLRINAAFMIGGSEYELNRRVGGSYARAETDGFFYAPSIAFAAPVDLLPVPFEIRGWANYTVNELDGYTESGVNVPLRVEKRTIDTVSLRGEVAMPQFSEQENGMLVYLTPRVGVDQQYSGGNDDVTISISGGTGSNPLAFNGSNVDRTMMFGGLDYRLVSADGSKTMGLSGELHSDFDDSFTASARVMVSLRF